MFLMIGLGFAAGSDDDKFPPPGGEGEIRMDPKDMPKEVQAAVAKRFPKAKVVGGYREEKKDKQSAKVIKTEYETKLKDENGKEMNVKTTDKGVFLTIETIVDVKDLPKAVVAAIEAKFPKAKMNSAEEAIKVKDGKEKVEQYEVEITDADGKSYDIEVSVDGTKFNKISVRK
jgi:hypothetical protein